MKSKILLGIIFFIISTALIIYLVPSLNSKAVDLFSYSQCDAPVPYKIGLIDARFNLSREEAVQDTIEAANIWGNEKGKQLFVYKPKAELTVNFIYDQRQALDTQIDEMNDKLKASSLELKQKIAAYEADVKSFEQRLKAFQETVDKYNSQGGAPENVYNDLKKQEKDLQAEGNSLNARARDLNLSTRNYNGEISTLNQNIDEFNLMIAQKPEEGLYNSEDNTITLYFVNHHDELIHTLAHEFGHALGMDHVRDPEAIMNRYTSELLMVTPDDKKELDYVCREQSAIIHYLQMFDLWLVKNIQGLRMSLQR